MVYWHVELPRHAALFAKALACESYLDTGSRAAFANGVDVIIAHPHFALQVWRAQGCGPLVTGSAALARAKARLIARLPALG